MTAYASLAEHLRQITALEQIGGLLSWDQETMMPRIAAGQRAEQMGALEAVIHGLRTDPRIDAWCDAAEAPNAAGAVNIEQARRITRRATRVPAALAIELAKVSSEAQGIWADAREAQSFSDFAPTLTRIVALKREEAEAIRSQGQGRYEALLEDFEPGMDTASLSTILDALKPGLVALREMIAGAIMDVPVLTGTYAPDAQMHLAARIAEQTGYVLEKGRLDLSTHPFSSGSGHDVRITTRVDPAEPLGCLYSTLHECGHALYELGIDPELAMQPAGRWVSMGIHESQSRCLENQIGRSRAFCEWLYPMMRGAFDDFTLGSPEDLYRAVNRVESGFIRTQADEVHYNLHIILRFGLERDLIEGRLDVVDLEAAWNERFAEMFGISVPDPARGVLQDVHWSVGLFGYFPTYSLGNIYAGCLFEAMRRDIPQLDAEMARGELSNALAWQRQAVHRHGSLKAPADLMEDATGAPPTERPLLAYLTAKFSDLYAT